MNFKQNSSYNHIKKHLESGNINFFIGSGASRDAINTLGDLESDLTTLIRDYRTSQNKEIIKQISEKINDFLAQSVSPNQNLIHQGSEDRKAEVTQTLERYKNFLNLIYSILINRGLERIPKKVNIFTTNYDLFHEVAAEEIGVSYNDGGNGIFNRYFSSDNFQKRVYRMSDYYSYQYEEPVINIIKLHGSLNWFFTNENVLIKNSVTTPEINNDAIDENGYIKENVNIPIILPTKQKFVRTLMEHMYYDLSRYFANELEREQSVLFCTGFSFADEHLRSITKRALGNPSLTVLIFPFSEEDELKLLRHFSMYNNVKIIRITKVDTEEESLVELSFIENYQVDSSRQNIDFKTFVSFIENIHKQISESKVFL